MKIGDFVVFECDCRSCVAERQNQQTMTRHAYVGTVLSISPDGTPTVHFPSMLDDYPCAIRNLRMITEDDYVMAVLASL